MDMGLLGQSFFSQRLLRRKSGATPRRLTAQGNAHQDTTEPSYEVCSTEGTSATQLRAALTVGQYDMTIKRDVVEFRER